MYTDHQGALPLTQTFPKHRLQTRIPQQIPVTKERKPEHQKTHRKERETNNVRDTKELS